jgi:hypothetical protein
MRPISATSFAPYSTALTPCGASDEWQVRPRTVTRTLRLLLWPITTPMPEGSPTKQASGRTGFARSRSTMPRAPTQPTSSS